MRLARSTYYYRGRENQPANHERSAEMNASMSATLRPEKINR
jgi:hypothetical protein